MVTLHAYVSLKPEKVQDAIEACRIVRAASVLEPGCDRYDFFQSPDDATQLVFVEEWASKEALDQHFLQDAFLQFVEKMNLLTAKPTELIIFESTKLPA